MTYSRSEFLNKTFLELYNTIIEDCPNKKIVHLFKHSRKRRVIKKNLNRIFNMFWTK